MPGAAIVGTGALGAAGPAIGAGLDSALLTGAAGGGSGGGNKGMDQLLGQYNSILNKAMQNAINESTGYTNSAVAQQQQGLKQSQKYLTDYMDRVRQDLTGYSQGGFNMGQGLNAPYRDAGYNALDAFNQSLGLNTPRGGSRLLAEAQSKIAQRNLLANTMFGQGGAPTSMPSGNRLTLPQGLEQSLQTGQWKGNASEWNNKLKAMGLPEINAGLDTIDNMNAINSVLKQKNAPFDYQDQVAQLGITPEMEALTAPSKETQMANLLKQYGGQAPTAPTDPGAAPTQLGKATQADVLAAYGNDPRFKGGKFYAENPYDQSINWQTGGDVSDLNSLLSQIEANKFSKQLIYQKGNEGMQNPRDLIASLYGEIDAGNQSKYQKDLDAYNAKAAEFKKYQDYQKEAARINAISGDAANSENVYGSPNGQGGAQGGQGGAQGGSTDGLMAFLNSPQYQALYGTENTQTNPVDRFRFDPGYQFAIDEGLKQLQQKSASRGLLESGATQRDIQQFSQGMADQNYQRWLEQQNNVFANRQNQLMGLSTLGSQLTGASTAASLFGNLGNQLAQYNFGTGQALANNQQGTSSNISSLYANQGVLNANAYLNTGAARAQGLMNIAGMGMQQQNNQQASQAQQQTGNYANQGAIMGSSLFGQRQINPGFGGGSNGYSFQPNGPQFTGGYY